MKKINFLFLTGTFGALALVSQVLLVRQLLVVFYGSEMIVALVLAGWLVGVSLGAKVMGAAGDRPAPERGLVFGPLLWILALAGLMALSFRLSSFMGLSPGEVAPLDRIMIWTLVLTCPASFFVGALFVLAGRYYQATWPEAGSENGGVGGIIFMAESAGSCLGLLIYTFLLAGRFGAVGNLVLFAGLMILAQALALLKNPVIGKSVVVVIIILLLLYNLSGLARNVDLAANRARFQAAFPSYELLAAGDTPYQHLTLAKRGGETVLFGNQTFYASWPNPYHYQVLALFFLTEAPHHGRILLAGQGPGGFIHELLARDVRRLVYVALDPDETEMIVSHLPPDQARDPADPRLSIIHDDIRRFLDRTTEVFDLIVINAPDPDNAQINRLYTREFFQAAAARLSDRGVLATSISGAENYWGRELISYGVSLYRTMKAVFPEVLVTPGDTHYFLAGRTPGLVSDDPLVLADRYRKLGYESKYIRPQSFRTFFYETGRDYIKERLAETGPVRLNTDAAPLTYFLRLIWWERLTGSETARALLQMVFQIKTWGPWAALLLVSPLVFILFRPAPARISQWTIITTGGATMALQIIQIFLFQNKYGVIYRDIGLISCLFMAGLAAGAWLGGRRSVQGLPARKLLSRLEMMTAAVCLATALTAWGVLPMDLVLVLPALTGLVSGFEFAAFFSFYLTDPGKPSVAETLSGLEAGDHGGAVIGALTAGLVLVPVLGLGAGALVLAVYKAVSSLTIYKAIQN